MTLIDMRASNEMEPRTILQICTAVKDNEQDIGENELRLTIAALSAIQHFYRSTLIDIIEAIREDSANLKLKAEFAWGTYERMYNALNTPAAKWLGPENIPGTPEQQKRMRIAKAIYNKITMEE